VSLSDAALVLVIWMVAGWVFLFRSIRRRQRHQMMLRARQIEIEEAMRKLPQFPRLRDGEDSSLDADED
jgi:Tfp pilus assembly protein PilN